MWGKPEGDGVGCLPAAVASIILDGGFAVSYRGSWISTGPGTPWTGEWRMEFERGEILWSSRGEDSSPAELVVVQRRRGAPVSLATRAMKRIDRWATLAECAHAVRNHRDPQSSGRENLGSLALMNAAGESATPRRPRSSGV